MVQPGTRPRFERDVRQSNGGLRCKYFYDAYKTYRLPRVTQYGCLAKKIRSTDQNVYKFCSYLKEIKLLSNNVRRKHISLP
jgi:hypothetical protein